MKTRGAVVRVKHRHRKTSLSLALLCVVTSGACLVGPAWMVDYEYSTSALRGGTTDAEVSLVTSNRGREIDLLAGDNVAQFSFAVSPGNIVVSIENRQSEILNLNLEDASFIDSEGNVHPLFAWAVSDSGRREALAKIDGVRQVKGGSTLKLSLWPKEWTRERSDGQPYTWKGDSPFGGGRTVAPSRSKALEGRKEDIGQHFEIVLPVQVGLKAYSYRFIFTATALRLKRTLWA